MSTQTLNQRVRTIIEGYLDMGIDEEQARQSLIELDISGVTEVVSASAFLATCLMSHDMGVLDEWLDYFTARMEVKNETKH